MIVLTPTQDSALKVIRKKILDGSMVTILQGFAGSGKSTVLNFLLQSLPFSEQSVVFVAFTGAATQVLQSKGVNAQTIHSLIYKPILVGGICIGFERIPKYQLSGLKLIVVDEFSMVSEELMSDLLSFGIPLLLVGDSAQLPPIGTPNQFTNQYDVMLTEVMRQALENPILWAATKIRQGETVVEGVYGDILMVGRQHQLNEGWLRKDVQFICGRNETRNKLNIQIKGNSQVEKGDKIIFLKNDQENGVVNGTLAEILYFEKGYRNKYKLNFIDDMGLRHRDYYAFFQTQITKRDQFFDWAYAITCHKAQGATFDSPGVIIDESFCFKGLREKWIYTALTRYTGNYKVAWLR